MTAYFERLDESRFLATRSVEGAWNTDEQHIAPALGLLTHMIERHRDGRRDDVELTRLSFDILGTLPIGTVDVSVQVIRPGRTIELVEASLAHAGRTAVLLRAWLHARRDTARQAGSDSAPLADPESFPSWDGSEIWPGEFVRTVDVRRHESAPGRAQFWLRPRVPLVAGEDASTTASALSVLDIANGITPRRSPREVAFPNLDTTVHLFAQPRSDWIGYDTTVSFGSSGAGLTQSTMHDLTGPIGVAAQTLTVRPR